MLEKVSEDKRGTLVCDDLDVITIIRGEIIVYIGGAQLFHLRA